MYFITRSAPWAIVATLASAFAAPPAYAEGTPPSYGSVGLRYAIWGEADDNFETRNSPIQTAEFSWSLGSKSVFRARLEQASKTAADRADKVRRYGLDALFQGLVVSTEFGRIGGISKPSSELTFQDVGVYEGTYSNIGLYQSGFTGWGLIYVDKKRPKLWRHSEGACSTVSTHCYFTDRDTTQELLMVAWRIGDKLSGEPIQWQGWGIDINAVWALGLGRSTPSAKAVAGASRTSGIAVSPKTVNGLAYYIDGQYGVSYGVRSGWGKLMFTAGLYYRDQGQGPSLGSSERGQPELWDITGGSDYGPYFRLTASF
jgi:hypothetical protein